MAAHRFASRKAFTALAKAFDRAVRDVRDGRMSDEPAPRIDPRQAGLMKFLGETA
jgi:hypothetical protein